MIIAPFLNQPYLINILKRCCWDIQCVWACLQLCYSYDPNSLLFKILKKSDTAPLLYMLLDTARNVCGQVTLKTGEISISMQTSLDSPFSQKVPFPEYPGWHVQLNIPIVSTHIPSAWQLWSISVHSLTTQRDVEKKCQLSRPIGTVLESSSNWPGSIQPFQWANVFRVRSLSTTKTGVKK